MDEVGMLAWRFVRCELVQSPILRQKHLNAGPIVSEPQGVHRIHDQRSRQLIP